MGHCLVRDNIQLKATVATLGIMQHYMLIFVRDFAVRRLVNCFYQ